MQNYYGTKRVKATPMTQHAFAAYIGQVKKSNMPDTSPEGYLVEYTDGGEPNYPNLHSGYISWAPKDVFDRAYQPTTAMAFGHAVEALKAGRKVSREGWNGKGMFLYMEEESESFGNLEAHSGIREHFVNQTVFHRAHIMMLTAQNDVVPWLASQSDILANDWCIVD